METCFVAQKARSECARPPREAMLVFTLDNHSAFFVPNEDMPDRIEMSPQKSAAFV
jgi:hypothetical protein